MELGGGRKTWETLDSVALARIFSHLPPKDQLSAGLVCKTWKTVSRSPELWKDVEINFNGDQEKFNGAIKFFQSNAPCPTSIKLRFSSTDGNAVRCASRYLEHVAKEQCVREVTLEVSYEDSAKYSLSSFYLMNEALVDLMEKIQRFLSTQSRVKAFTFNNFRIKLRRSVDGINFLSKMAATNNGLTKLDLSNDIFGYFALKETNIGRRYGSVLGRFQNLSSLSLALADMTDATLEVLADSFTNGKLKLFCVKITNDGFCNWLFDETVTEASQEHVSRLTQNNPGLVIKISSMKDSATLQNWMFTSITNVLLRTRMRTKTWLLFSDWLDSESPAPGLQIELIDKEDGVIVNCYGLPSPDLLLHRFLNSYGCTCPRLERVDYGAPSSNVDVLIMGELNEWTGSAAGRAFTVTYPPLRPRRTHSKRKKSDSPSTEAEAKKRKM